MRKNDGIRRLIEELREMKLGHMAGALEDLYGSKDFDALDRLTFLEQIIGPEYEATTNKQYENRLKRAHLSGGPQTIENCRDSVKRSYLPTGIVDTLSSLDFIKKGLTSASSVHQIVENHIWQGLLASRDVKNTVSVIITVKPSLRRWLRSRQLIMQSTRRR